MEVAKTNKLESNTWQSVEQHILQLILQLNNLSLTRAI